MCIRDSSIPGPGAGGLRPDMSSPIWVSTARSWRAAFFATVAGQTQWPEPRDNSQTTPSPKLSLIHISTAVRGAEKGTCRREDKLCVSNHSLVNQGCGNLIAGKCRTGEAVADCRCLIGIVDLRLRIVGLVAAQLRCSRHQQICILWL